jgi:hypothetical protein
MKNILVENFYACKIVVSKSGMNNKFSSKFIGRKFFMVAKKFSRKLVCTQNFYEKFLVKNIYGCKIVTSKPGLNKKLSSKFLVENFLWLQNRYLENR